MDEGVENSGHTPELTNGMCACVGDNLLRVGRGYEMNYTCENACIKSLNRHGLVKETLPLM